MAVGYEEAVGALESMGEPPDELAGATFRHRMVLIQLSSGHTDNAVAVRDLARETIREEAEAVVEASSIATSVAIPPCP